MKFTEKLNKVVEELKSNPEIYVAHYQVLPADINAIDEVEKELGYKLDNSITDFYKECGGIQLFWLSKSNEEFETKKEYFRTELEKRPLFDFQLFYGGAGSLHDGNSWDDLITEGVILIPSIKTVFLDKNYIGDADEYADKADMERYGIFENISEIKVRKFEMFDLCVNIAFILDGKPNPAMLTAYDNYEYGDSAIIDFSDYLELILKSKGSIKRGHGFLISSDFEHEKITLQDVENLDLSL
jgi:hypothetical protein